MRAVSRGLTARVRGSVGSSKPRNVNDLWSPCADSVEERRPAGLAVPLGAPDGTPPTCSDQALQRTLNLPLICAWDDACGLAGYGASMHAQAYDRARRYLSLPPLGWPHWASLLVALILSLVLGYA